MMNFLKGGPEDPYANENVDPVQALYESLKRHGKFETELDGTLTLEAMLKIRESVLRQASRKFKPKRIEFDEKRMEAFANKDQALYSRTLREQNTMYSQLCTQFTQMACKAAVVEYNNFMLSMKKWSSDANAKPKILAADSLTR